MLTFFVYSARRNLDVKTNNIVSAKEMEILAWKDVELLCLYKAPLLAAEIHLKIVQQCI